MQIIYYPNQERVTECMQLDEPLLMLVKHDESEIIISCIDDSFEHLILLKKVGYSEREIDKYYRIVVNNDGADWTFVCPTDYLGITDRETRIKRFYNNGIETITKALKLIGYEVEINIPKRYRRHLDIFN